MGHASSRRSPFAFTLIELLVVISIIALLISILLPALQQSRAVAQKTVCMTRVRSLQMAWLMYAEDNDGGLVSANTDGPENAWIRRGRSDWDDYPYRGAAIMEAGALWPYVESHEIYQCTSPLFEKDHSEDSLDPVYFGINGCLNGDAWWVGLDVADSLDEIRNPSDTFVFVEERAVPGYITYQAWVVHMTDNYWIDLPAGNHLHGDNLSFADGHVEFWRWEDPETLTVGQWDQRSTGDLERVADAFYPFD